MMDPIERKQKIAELEESRLANIEEIERRQREREEDPIKADDWLRAECANENHGSHSPEIERKDLREDIQYRDYTPPPEQDFSGWEKWMAGHINNLREEMLDAVAEALVEERATFKKQLADLRSENARLEAMIKKRHDDAS